MSNDKTKLLSIADALEELLSTPDRRAAVAFSLSVSDDELSEVFDPTTLRAIAAKLG